MSSSSSSSIHDSEKKMDQATIILDENTQKTIDSIKNIASNIREASNKARDTMRVLRQSGAINELTSAIQEAMIASRDTTREINETAEEAFRDRGVIRDTASHMGGRRLQLQHMRLPKQSRARLSK